AECGDDLRDRRRRDRRHSRGGHRPSPETAGGPADRQHRRHRHRCQQHVGHGADGAGKGRTAALRVTLGRHRKDRQRQQQRARRSERREEVDTDANRPRSGQILRHASGAEWQNHIRRSDQRRSQNAEVGRPRRRESRRAGKGSHETMKQGLLAIALLTVAASAFASWYDDYDAGIDAMRKGNYPEVIKRMTAAIAGNSKENNNTRTYGNIFISYHPYYYRGLAYLRSGQYDKAIKDLELTSGPGELDRG